MRERQQMASRPFASVAVALELGGDQEELLQVSVTYYTHAPAQEGAANTGAVPEERVCVYLGVRAEIPRELPQQVVSAAVQAYAMQT